MAARPQNKDQGNSLYNSMAARKSGTIYNPEIRNSGGFPSNPVPISDRVTANPNLKMIAIRKRLDKIIGPNKVPPIKVPPDIIAPIFRPTPFPVMKGWHPSKNLGNIFHNKIDSIELHPAVLPSNPFPFRTIHLRDGVMTVNREATRIIGSMKGHDQNGPR